MIERAIIFILIFGSLTACSSETPEERAALCVWQKNEFTRGRLCDAVYDIGEQFLKDPTSTWTCSDDEIQKHIKWTSTLYKHQLNKCASDEADYYIYNIYNILKSSGAKFAICGTRSDGKDLYSETEKKYGAFLACRNYRIAN